MFSGRHVLVNDVMKQSKLQQNLETNHKELSSKQRNKIFLNSFEFKCYSSIHAKYFTGL